MRRRQLAVVGLTLGLLVVGNVAHDPVARAQDWSAGQLDPTFGTGGAVATDFGGGDDYAGQVVIQPDGKILLVLQASYWNRVVRFHFGAVPWTATSAPATDATSK